MVEIRVQGYENQVKLFLLLLVLFLAAVGAVSLMVLTRAQDLLLEEAEVRVTAATRAVQRELNVSELTAAARDPRAGASLVPRLRELARAYAITSIEVLDPDGTVLTGTEPWRLGIRDPLGAQVALSDMGSLGSGRAAIRESERGQDDPQYGKDRGEVFVFLELAGAGAERPLLLKAGHEVLGVRTVTRQIRMQAWTQAIAGALMLALVLLFVRWVLKPYRALRAAAARIDAPEASGNLASGDDPGELVSAFTGVIEKLKDQEVELERMRALGSAGLPAAASQELLNGLTSGVMILGADGRIEALNPAGLAILGASRDRILGRDFRDVFGSSPGLVEVLKDGVERGRSRSREVVAYVPGEGDPGPPAHLGVTISAIPSGAGRPSGAFCLFSDLTEIRGLQERVRVKESLASLGQMSAGIAHEFRNSLATVLGYARLIGREPRASGELSEHAAAIVREVQSIGRTVDDFLRYARPAKLQSSRWDPRTVIEEVARETARADGRAGIAIAIAGQWPESIRADEALLRQAFGNLLRNALEAIPSDAGLVTVTGTLEEGGDQLRIEVADSGTGIPPEVLQRLFTPFVTTKSRGTGLGLALAQKAIVSHDGEISARNSAGGGASFVVSLPLLGRS